MLVFGDQDWITTLHYSFQDKENLVRDSPGKDGGEKEWVKERERGGGREKEVEWSWGGGGGGGVNIEESRVKLKERWKWKACLCRWEPLSLYALSIALLPSLNLSLSPLSIPPPVHPLLPSLHPVTLHISPPTPVPGDGLLCGWRCPDAAQQV